MLSDAQLNGFSWSLLLFDWNITLSQELRDWLFIVSFIKIQSRVQRQCWTRAGRSYLYWFDQRYWPPIVICGVFKCYFRDVGKGRIVKFPISKFSDWNLFARFPCGGSLLYILFRDYSKNDPVLSFSILLRQAKLNKAKESKLYYEREIIQKCKSTFRNYIRQNQSLIESKEFKYNDRLE